MNFKDLILTYAKSSQLQEYFTTFENKKSDTNIRQSTSWLMSMLYKVLSTSKLMTNEVNIMNKKSIKPNLKSRAEQ